MPGVRRYEDLVAWQLSMEACEVIFDATETGPAARDPEFRDQIREAVRRTAPQIAEGFLRYTPAEFVRFLRMARSSLGEVQNHLEFARRRRYLPREQQLQADAITRRAMIAVSRLLKSKLPLLRRRRHPRK